MSDDLERRLRALEDRAEIHQLFVDYGMHLDAGRFDEYAKLFASDGEVQLGPMGRAVGPVEIEALMRKVLGGRAGESYHLITSPRIEVDGDTATSEVMWTVVNRTEEDTPVVTMMGRHRDELVREDGRWRFRIRRGLMDIPESFPR